MTVQTHSAPERTTTQPTGLRKRLLPFTGLIPVVLMVPVLAFDLYGLAIVLALVSGAGVIVYHVSRGQGVSSLDVNPALLRRAQRRPVLRLRQHDPARPHRRRDLHAAHGARD